MIKKTLLITLLLGLSFSGLYGCASSESGGTNIADVRIDWVIEPEQLQQGQESRIQLTITGLQTANKTRVQIDIMNANNKGVPELIEMKETSQDQYEANYTFDEAANFNIIAHVYSGDIHITKKKTVEVTA